MIYSDWIKPFDACVTEISICFHSGWHYFCSVTLVDNFSTVEKRMSQSSDNASKSSSPLRTKVVEPVLKFQATAPDIYIFWLWLQHLDSRRFGSGSGSRAIWSKISEKKFIICITRLSPKLSLWIRNPNFRLRLQHLKVFGSGSCHPKLLQLRLHSPAAYQAHSY